MVPVPAVGTAVWDVPPDDLDWAAPRRRRLRIARTVVAWAAVAVSAAWLTVRASGAGQGTVVETFIVFTPYVALGTLLAIPAALLLRAPRAALAAAGCAVGYALVLAPLFLWGPRPVPPPRGPELRVATANVQFGRADAAALVRLVRDRDVDVLGVQELTPGFADRLDDAGIGDLLPHRILEPGAGAAGSGLYSRFPVEPVADEVTGRFASPTGRLDVPGAPPVEVTVVHAVPPVSGEGRADWAGTMDTLPRPDPRGAVHLLIGDFNATVDQPTLRDLLDDGYVDAAGAVGRGWAVTWRTRLTPPLAIDHVLVDRATAVREASEHGVPGSDHRAVLAHLRLPTAA